MIGWESIPRTNPFSPTARAAIWHQPPGAAPRSSTRPPGGSTWKRSWISSSLNADRARRPSFLALRQKQSRASYERGIAHLITRKAEAPARWRESLGLHDRRKGLLRRRSGRRRRLGRGLLALLRLLALLCLLGRVRLAVGLGVHLGLGGRALRHLSARAEGDENERGERGGDRADHRVTPEVLSAGGSRGQLAATRAKPMPGKSGRISPPLSPIPPRILSKVFLRS